MNDGSRPESRYLIVAALGVGVAIGIGIGMSFTASATGATDTAALVDSVTTRTGELVDRFETALHEGDARELGRVMSRAELERLAGRVAFVGPGTMTPTEMEEFERACERFGVSMESVEDPVGFLAWALPRYREIREARRGPTVSGEMPTIVDVQLDHLEFTVTVLRDGVTQKMCAQLALENGEWRINLYLPRGR